MGFFTAFFTTWAVLTTIIGIGYLILGIADDHEAVKQGYRSVRDRELKQLDAELAALKQRWYADAVTAFKASGELPADWNGPVPTKVAAFIAGDLGMAKDNEWRWDHTYEEELILNAMWAEFQKEYDRRHFG